MKAHLATAACAAILSLQLPIASNADGLAFAQAGLRRCGGDIARLCDDVFPGGGRIAQCLIDQFERLSPPCRSHVAKGKLAKTIVFACEADAARVCPDVRPGDGRIVFCLNDNRTRLSTSCNRALDGVEDVLAR